MIKHSILIMLHCEQNTGYAIASLEKVFESASLLAGYSENNIYWSFSEINESKDRCHEISYYSESDAEKLRQLIRRHSIDVILAYDLPYPTVIAKVAQQEGVAKIISYWGASMSSINSGLKLLLKRLEWYLCKKEAPTIFIFESEAMRAAATHGRGVPSKLTVVIPLGVDTNIYYPERGSLYAHKVFNIPIHRKIIFYSGHMEERKGVRVLIEAMIELERQGKLEPLQLLVCGDKGNESNKYIDLLLGSRALGHVTFGGYRDDIPELMRSSFLGVIASTGWDSFTMSSVEMLSSGLPLIVSELQGLKETIVPGLCGQYIKPGDAKALAFHVYNYYQDQELWNASSLAARERAVRLFNKDLQINEIGKVF